MKFSSESSKLVKTAVAHRRMAHAAQKRLSRSMRGVVYPGSWSVEKCIKHIDANRRCSADDFAMAREVAK